MALEQFKVARWILGPCLVVALAGAARAGDPAPADRTPEQQATDAANAQKAQYDAQTAKYQADEERIKAAQAALPASGLTNSATANAGAGTAEANYLASRLIGDTAKSIYADSADKICSKPVTIFSGFSAPDLSDYGNFEARRQAILDDMQAAIKSYSELPPAPKPHVAPHGRATKTATFLPAVTALIPSLLSYLSSNDTSQGVTVSTSDNMLLTSLAGILAQHCAVRIASVQPNQGASAAIGKKISELTDKRRIIAMDMKTLGDLKKPTAAQKTVAANLATAAAEYDQFRLDLVGGVGPDGKAVTAALPLGNVVKEYAIASTIGDRNAVFASIQSASGGLYTRKNLTTFFGVNPFAVSASAVAYYAVVDGSTQDTIAAGTKQLITPYSELTKLK